MIVRTEVHVNRKVTQELDEKVRKIMNDRARTIEVRRKRLKHDVRYEPWPHADTIILSLKDDDEVEWWSKTHGFKVTVHPDPDFELVKGAPESPFRRKYLTSKSGEAVRSGQFQKNALDQKFYKVTIEVEGFEPLDPCIIGHDDTGKTG